MGHFGRVFTEERKGNESIESGEQSDEAFHKFLFCFCVISRFVSDFFRRQNYRRPSQRKDGRRSTLIMIIVNSRGAVSRRPSIFFLLILLSKRIPHLSKVRCERMPLDAISPPMPVILGVQFDADFFIRGLPRAVFERLLAVVRYFCRIWWIADEGHRCLCPEKAESQ